MIIRYLDPRGYLIIRIDPGLVAASKFLSHCATLLLA